MQLDRTNVKVVGEMEDVPIRLPANEKIYQYIDIVIADISEGFGIILNMGNLIFFINTYCTFL